MLSLFAQTAVVRLYLFKFPGLLVIGTGTSSALYSALIALARASLACL